MTPDRTEASVLPRALAFSRHRYAASSAMADSHRGRLSVPGRDDAHAVHKDREASTPALAPNSVLSAATDDDQSASGSRGAASHL